MGKFMSAEDRKERIFVMLHEACEAIEAESAEPSTLADGNSFAESAKRVREAIRCLWGEDSEADNRFVHTATRAV